MDATRTGVFPQNPNLTLAPPQLVAMQSTVDVEQTRASAQPQEHVLLHSPRNILIHSTRFALVSAYVISSSGLTVGSMVETSEV